ncbi:Hypothetical protein CINCED_3A016644 [Cinara cedri]|uniref:SKICH domain-containing protein n=1 Tax=Cinara cedri TaxID=506608 RepID=A0A5E4NK59_9HEMI|nr:Hypothetical protein CINCED_3A016644 [Cinara cedri]
MEKIVKIFVHQSYFLENDLVVDYNVEPGAHLNVSSKDWIALIPKGWSGVDEQVVFKMVKIDSDVANLAIKSVIMEKNCFQNVVECEKPYQLMYISQYLEILGRSEYFTFLHQSGICNCPSSLTKTESKENSRQFRTSVFNRKPLRRQSPTPREFYKNRPQSQNTGEKDDKLKSKPLSINNCIKCNAPSNFIVLEHAYLSKIQELTVNNEIMEKRLLQIEKDLVHTFEIVNKQFKISQVISQQKDNIEQFVDDIVHGLLNDGKITFWAHAQEFSVVREFPGKNRTSLPPDDCTTVSVNMSINSSKEAHMKAIIGQQEQTIQLLVNKIRDSFDIFFKANIPSEQNSSILTSPRNKMSNLGYMDSSGTTYFSPLGCITDTNLYHPQDMDTVDDINLYLSNNIKHNNTIEKKFGNVCKWRKNITSNSEFFNSPEFKVITMSNKEAKDEISTLEELKDNDNSIYPLYSQLSEFSENCSNELLDSNEMKKNYDSERNGF